MLSLLIEAEKYGNTGMIGKKWEKGTKKEDKPLKLWVIKIRVLDSLFAQI